mgnify:CR=1 FL=1
MKIKMNRDTLDSLLGNAAISIATTHCKDTGKDFAVTFLGWKSKTYDKDDQACNPDSSRMMEIEMRINGVDVDPSVWFVRLEQHLDEQVKKESRRLLHDMIYSIKNATDDKLDDVQDVVSKALNLDDPNEDSE